MNTGLLTKQGTLRQLEAFMTVAETGSIARASEALFMTPPGVSIQVKKLSDALDITLYEVIGKKIHLTEAGLEVVKTGREVFESIQRLDDCLNNLKGLDAGTLRIAVVTTAKYFLPNILGPFCKQFPGIDVEFKVGNRAQIIERMNNNLDDLYFFSDPPSDLDIMQYEFLPNPIAVIASSQNPLASRKRLTWSDLDSETLLVREQGSGTANAIQKHLDKHHFTINKKMVIESNEAIKYAVMANMGVSILSAYTLAREEQDGLVQLPVTTFPILSHWYVVHLKDKKLSIVAQNFLEHVLMNGKQYLPMEKIESQLKRVLDKKT
ncbi:LysR family transcriptional regulator [bacterium]|nr:LysR family transcriptional regulator [bacterium]